MYALSILIKISRLFNYVKNLCNYEHFRVSRNNIILYVRHTHYIFLFVLYKNIHYSFLFIMLYRAYLKFHEKNFSLFNSYYAARNMVSRDLKMLTAKKIPEARHFIYCYAKLLCLLSSTVMQNKYLANEKNLFMRKPCFEPIFCLRSGSDMLISYVSRNQVPRFHFCALLTSTFV